MSDEASGVLHSKFFYLGGIVAVSLVIITLAWLFQGTNWSLILLSSAWVLVVAAFAWEIVTRAERLDNIVHSRTDSLERNNRHLNRLLELLRGFRRVSYEINQKTGVEQIGHAFVERVNELFDEPQSVHLWLDRRLVDKKRKEEGNGSVSLHLVAAAGEEIGMPSGLERIERSNPLVARCFQDRSVAVEHELSARGGEEGWDWLADSGMESFAAFRLEVGETILGVLGVFSARTLTADFVRQLHLSVNQLAVALEKGRLLKAMRRRARQLAAAYKELRELDEMKDWFICSVSHELRTPLTSIISFSEILEHYEDLEAEEHREFAGVIREESQRLARLIDDMLDLSRIARDELKLEAGQFDMAAVARRSARLFERQAAEKDMELRLELPAEAPAYADEHAASRVLNNLLSNAFKFTPEGGTVELSVSPDDSTVVTRVRDTGPGIPPEDQEKVFQKFTQLESQLTSKPAGSGIGLAICREIVERSGGRIWVDSRPGEGSTFAFALPNAPRQERSAADKAAETHQITG
ncbi:MAG: sensor histidine kinase [Planctomycetota bacterium]